MQSDTFMVRPVPAFYRINSRQIRKKKFHTFLNTSKLYSTPHKTDLKDYYTLQSYSFIYICTFHEGRFTLYTYEETRTAFYAKSILNPDESS